jgi:hypothetical protein
MALRSPNWENAGEMPDDGFHTAPEIGDDNTRHKGVMYDEETGAYANGCLAASIDPSAFAAKPEYVAADGWFDTPAEHAAAQTAAKNVADQAALVNASLVASAIAAKKALEAMERGSDPREWFPEWHMIRSS